MEAHPAAFLLGANVPPTFPTLWAPEGGRDEGEMVSLDVVPHLIVWFLVSRWTRPPPLKPGVLALIPSPFGRPPSKECGGGVTSQGF